MTHIQAVLAAVFYALCNAAFAEGNWDPTTSCPVPEGCQIPSTSAHCAVIACKAKACKGDYSSGDCKDLKELHEIACIGVPKKCGGTLPRVVQNKSSPGAPQGPAKDVPPKQRPKDAEGAKPGAGKAAN